MRRDLVSGIPGECRPGQIEFATIATSKEKMYTQFAALSKLRCLPFWADSPCCPPPHLLQATRPGPGTPLVLMGIPFGLVRNTRPTIDPLLVTLDIRHE